MVVMDWLESVTEYMRLGLELGLSYVFLNTMRHEQGRKVEDCKRTLLHSWLERADRVDEMGGTNKSALVAALRRMGEHRVADNIILGLTCGWSHLCYTLTQSVLHRSLYVILLFNMYKDHMLSYVSCRFCSFASCSC